MTIGTYIYQSRPHTRTISVRSLLVLRDWFERKERELRGERSRFDRLNREARWAPLDTPEEEWVARYRAAEEARVRLSELNNELADLHYLLYHNGYGCTAYFGSRLPTPRTEEEILKTIEGVVKQRTTPGWDPFGEEY